jgi:hypothetical protein
VALSTFEVPTGPGITLDAGINYARVSVKFWSSLL